MLCSNTPAFTILGIQCLKNHHVFSFKISLHFLCNRKCQLERALNCAVLLVGISCCEGIFGRNFSTVQNQLFSGILIHRHTDQPVLPAGLQVVIGNHIVELPAEMRQFSSAILIHSGCSDLRMEHGLTLIMDIRMSEYLNAGLLIKTILEYHDGLSFLSQ